TSTADKMNNQALSRKQAPQNKAVLLHDYANDDDVSVFYQAEDGIRDGYERGDDLHAVQIARGGDGVDVHDVDADAREVRLHLGAIPAGGFDRVEQHVVGRGITAQGDELAVGIAVEREYRGGGAARDVHVDLVIDEFGIGVRFRERADLKFAPGFRRLLL